jgi:hypothetical protein
MIETEMMANIPEECNGMDRPAMERHVESSFRTPAGKALAAAKVLK